MHFWWVNQNQTYRQESAGGYLWSPKRKRGGSLHPYYEFMREVAPGDIVFSFAERRIRAWGRAASFAYEAPKPKEFGNTGRYWDEIGWRVDVAFHELLTVFRPFEWMSLLGPLLPKKYSPLRANGHGLQNMYLTKLPEPFALQLADLVDRELAALARAELVAEPQLATPPKFNAELLLWEEHLRQDIESDPALDSTEKESLVIARRGQGLFKERVRLIETRCRVTGVDRLDHLRASHCKPWRDSTNAERLDGNNGLLLTPSIDHLFDRGFISFRADGRLLVSPVAHHESLERMGVPTGRAFEAGGFTSAQGRFLEYHREEVFLSARVRS